MIEIYLDRKSSKLDVDVKVNGSDGKSFSPEVRFTLIKEGMRISFPASHLGSDKYTVSIPSLAGKLRAGQCEMEVEVMVDGKYFVPIKGTAVLKEDIRPIAEIKAPTEERRISLSANVRESIEEASPPAPATPAPAPKRKQISPSQLIKRNIIRRP